MPTVKRNGMTFKIFSVPNADYDRLIVTKKQSARMRER